EQVRRQLGGAVRYHRCPCCFYVQAADGIRAFHVTGVQTCALPIFGGQRRQLGDGVDDAVGVAGRRADDEGGPVVDRLGGGGEVEIGRASCRARVAAAPGGGPAWQTPRANSRIRAPAGLPRSSTTAW